MIGTEPIAATPATDPAAVLRLSWRDKAMGLVRHRVFGQAAQMVLWRFFGLALSAAGSIWAARCLGATKLGISGMIVATVAQVGLMIDLNQNVGLVRRFKVAKSAEEEKSLVVSIFAFRWLMCFGYMAIGGVALAFLGLSREWTVGLIAAFPLLLFTANQGVWVLQGQENMPAHQRAVLVQALVAAGSYFLFFRKGMMATGSDLVVQAFALGFEFTLGWWAAWKMLKPTAPMKLDFSLAKTLYWDGRWLAVSGLVSYVYVCLQTPLIGYLTNTQEVGYFRTAISLVNGFQAFANMAPVLLYPRLIEWSKRGPEFLWRRQCRLAVFLTLLILPASAAAVIGSPIVYKTLYGPEFLPAAYPFAVLLISKMLVVINGIFGWGLWAQNRDKSMLLIMTVAGAASLGLNLVLIPRLGILGASYVNLISEALVLAGTMLLSWRGLKKTVQP